MSGAHAALAVWQDEDAVFYWRLMRWRTASTRPPTWGIRAWVKPGDVEHVWYVPEPDDDERMRRCNPGTFGARPFTRVACG